MTTGHRVAVVGQAGVGAVASNLLVDATHGNVARVHSADRVIVASGRVNGGVDAVTSGEIARVNGTSVLVIAALGHRDAGIREGIAAINVAFVAAVAVFISGCAHCRSLGVAGVDFAGNLGAGCRAASDGGSHTAVGVGRVSGRLETRVSRRTVDGGVGAASGRVASISGTEITIIAVYSNVFASSDRVARVSGTFVVVVAVFGGVQTTVSVLSQHAFRIETGVSVETLVRADTSSSA